MPERLVRLAVQVGKMATALVGTEKPRFSTNIRAAGGRLALSLRANPNFSLGRGSGRVAALISDAPRLTQFY